MPSHVLIGFINLGNYGRDLAILIINFFLFSRHLWQRIMALNSCEGITLKFWRALVLTQKLLLGVGLRKWKRMHSKGIVSALSLRELTCRINQRKSLRLLNLNRGDWVSRWKLFLFSKQLLKINLVLIILILAYWLSCQLINPLDLLFKHRVISMGHSTCWLIDLLSLSWWSLRLHYWVYTLNICTR